jgi:hypothetical protein
VLTLVQELLVLGRFRLEFGFALFPESLG